MGVVQAGITYQIKTVGDMKEVLAKFADEEPIAVVSASGTSWIHHIYRYGYVEDSEGRIVQVQYEKQKALFIV